MGDVLVRQASLAKGRIESMKVGLHGLPDRTIDRDTALAWLRDGHSLVPVHRGDRLPALQLVDLGNGEWSIRTDNQALPDDEVPDLTRAG
jgi:hypothetical protein